jgi:acyl-CoA reductase-like NAD-dependent aldehyde dehydrogenase
MKYHYRQLIDGEWLDAAAGGTWDLVNPATEQVIQQVPFGDASDAQAAIDAAARAFPAWSRRTPYERGEVLLAAADWIAARVDEFARITTEEAGKPLAEARGEWTSASAFLRWFAAEGVRAYGRVVPARVQSRRIQVIHQPLGVVGSITAWNFPVYNNVRVWAAALAAGNTVVGRPSEYTPRTAMLLAQALHEGGAPAGVINLVNGDPAGMGQALLNDERVRKIQFTGSPRVGKLLMDGASRTMTRLSLELGGNAPVIVFPDAGNMELLAKLAVTWKTRNAGQVCVSPQRFFVHESAHDEFAEAAASYAATLRVGPGLEAQTQVGPLINASQRDRVQELVRRSAGGGAEVLTGGRAAPGRGYFFEPTVMTGVGPGSPVYDEEIFGPVMPVTAFSDAGEVLQQANASEYGLAAFVLTNDLNTAHLMSEGLQYGMVCINDWLPSTPEAPFGGIKASGMGRESGPEGLHEYLEPKTVLTGSVDWEALRR